MDLHGTEDEKSLLIMIIYWIVTASLIILFIEVYPGASKVIIGMVFIMSLCISYQVCKLIGD